MNDRRRPGALESDVLAALWASGEPMTPAEVRTAVSEELAYTTILTILRRLHEKGLVVRELLEGSRAFAYKPSVDQAEHAAEQMRTFLAGGSDRTAVLARFLGGLTSADRRTLLDLLTKRAKGA